MLEIVMKDNEWQPPELEGSELWDVILDTNPFSDSNELEYLHIFKVEPYIDAVYVSYVECENSETAKIRRFTFHDGYVWSGRDERAFVKHCLNNPKCMYSYDEIDAVYDYYSARYPQWHLQRYYSKSLRVLDHIYNCFIQNTAKEILYKSGFDELAQKVSDIDELNLLSSKPSEIYEGLSTRSLRALNCEMGAELLNESVYRSFLLKLQSAHPDVFKYKMNDAQCRYLKRLIDGQLTVGEAGRLYLARRNDLMHIWNESQYSLFTHGELQKERENEVADFFSKMDPIYRDYLKQVRDNDWYQNRFERSRVAELEYYLFEERDNLNKEIRRSNRRRPAKWQERNNGYVVRYPQTINDFCREAVYMSNCLLTYLEAFTKNDTTILFMRRNEDVNQPFITIEIYNNELKQAYHRFNENCTPEEAKWIRAYCWRHEISCGHFTFGEIADDLM